MVSKISPLIAPASSEIRYRLFDTKAHGGDLNTIHGDCSLRRGITRFGRSCCIASTQKDVVALLH